jgi:YVTN family beta-propeller protein
LDFRILGPLEVYDDEGREIELGGRQQRLVLAMLLLHPNEVVSVDRLIDVIWGERAPASAVKNVQVHVSRLRKALEPESRSGGSESAKGIVRTHSNGYILEVAPGELDVDRFQRLVEEGRRALAAGEPEDAGTILREALALLRGAPLADFTYDSFAQGEVGRLHELRLGALEERIDTDLALGRHDDVAAELQGFVSEHPLRERLRGQLMLALYRSGRQADALRVYEEARRALAEQLGLEPSESLQRLHQAVLTDDSALSAPARVAPSVETGRVARVSPPMFSGRRGGLLGLGGALLLAAALAVAVLEVTRDRTSAGIVSVAPNSLAAIDPETNRVVAQIPVGARPASVLFAHGSLWVANLDDDTVMRIDPSARRIVRTIATGTVPSGLAGGGGALWAIGGERGVVLRIDPAFNHVVDRIPTVEVGTLLTSAPATGAVAATTNTVWAVSGGFFSTPRLFRIDPAAKRATPTVATGNGPTAIAVGFGDLWITDSFEDTVSRVDPAGVVIETIPVGHGASAVAVGEGAVWVVDSLDDAVVRIDPETNSSTTVIPVGRYPSGIAVGAGAVWVANRNDGTVSRIDPETHDVVETIEVGNAPAGIAVAAGSVWVTDQAGGAGSRPEAVKAGGIARFSTSHDFQTDPALYPDGQINYATCAKLLNYPDAPAPVGTRLVPEVAASLPARSDDGRTYTFTIRRGFAFSPPLRERVTAETFKYAIERSLNPRMGIAARYVTGIVGQAAYQSSKAAHISGVVADRDKLSITLVEPAPDFLARLAMPFFCAVPLNTPIDPKGIPAIPAAGPYYIAAHVPNERIVLRRNPNYHGSRPHRLGAIHYTIGLARSRSVAEVEAGRSDYVADDIPPDPEAEAKLAARYGPASAAARNGKQRYFVNPTLALANLALNTSRPLFSNALLRKAVNYAIDRRALARQGSLVSGPFPAIPTDQYLPPTMPGASRRTLYPPAGDLRTARRLVPDARGTAVLYTCNLPLCRRNAQVIRSNLGRLGLNVDIREFPKDELFERAGTKGEPFDILDSHWFADYADPSDFLNVLLDQRIAPRGNLNVSYYTDAALGRKLERLARLSGDARYRAYAALSVELARDAAPWVAYAAGTARDLFSARIGCQIFQPVYGMDLAALCTRP